MRVIIAVLLAAVSLAACDRFDPNARAQYGETGLPKNCRAYVQAVIDGYRSKQYTAEESMNGLERNCGLNGHAWKPD